MKGGVRGNQESVRMICIYNIMSLKSTCGMNGSYVLAVGSVLDFILLRTFNSKILINYWAGGG